MCGIVGAVAQRHIEPILLEGLRRLEYRGYDSAGVAIINPEETQIQRVRCPGKVSELTSKLEKEPLLGSTGIAHTRWATHGQPTQTNAHPHFSNQQDIAVVHNGIIENHDALREKLIKLGYEFVTETDSEVIAHLIHHHLQKKSNLLTAIQDTADELHGAYAIGVIAIQEPHALYGVRQGCPLVVGIGIGEHFLGSDPLALLPVTQRFSYLHDGDIVKLSLQNVEIFDKKRNPIQRDVRQVSLEYDAANKGQYRHYMQKEIFEQPESIIDTINGHIIDNHIAVESFGHRAKDIFNKIERIQIVACGTSYHAGMVAKYWLENLANIPCQVEIASEYRYRKTVVEPNALMIALSQSGETADTLAALYDAKNRGFSATLAICNVPESSMIREADLTFLMHAGPEVGVAATKTFTAQLVALLLFSTLMQQLRSPSSSVETTIEAVKQLPHFIQQALELNPTIEQLSESFVNKQHALFLGRGVHYPIALEGALKLKEISYLHAEAYPAGELKHGPLALVDQDMPIITIAPKDNLIEKLESNLQEVSARGGQLYVFVDEKINWKPRGNITLIKMPHVPEIIAPIVYTIPLQLLAYHIAVIKGTDVDQPRNLAKSVTVE